LYAISPHSPSHLSCKTKLSLLIAYANKHGYDLQVDYEGPGAWHKLNMIENAINKRRYDWIWWMDFDTLITNKTIKITDIIEEALQKHKNPDMVSMMLTADW
jgi:mannan polymerase II complex MNN10 subunit